MHRDPKQSIAANDQAWDDKANWHATQADCYRFGRPGVNPYYGSSGMPLSHMPQQRGILLGEEVYDSTLARAVTRLANRIVQDVCPPGVKWTEFTGTLTERGTSENGARLQTLRDRAFKAIHTSNGDQALHEMVMDCVVSGNGVVRIGAGQEPDTPLSFDSTSQVEVAFEAGPRGAIWGYHRKFLLPREHIRAMWPDADLPVETGLDTKDAGYKPPLYNVYESTYYDPEAGHWWYDVLSKGTYGREQQPEMRLLEQASPISRWVGWRWARLPGEIYGRSPVMDALPALPYRIGARAHPAEDRLDAHRGHLHGTQ